MLPNDWLTIPSPPDEPRFQCMPAWAATLTCVSAALLTVALMVLPGSIATRFIADPTAESLIAALLGVIGTLLGYLCLARLLGVGTDALFITRPTPRNLSWAGIGLGIGGMVIATAGLLGWVTVSPGALSIGEVAAHLATGIAIGLWTGTLEELFLRGVVLAVLGHRWHWPGAIVATAVLFGLLHHGAAETMTATLFYVAITTVAGLFFGLITVASRSVWNAVAFHAAWNALFSDFVVGVRVSSALEPVFVVRTSDHPAVAAGGASLTESPLSMFLFGLVLFGTYWRIRQQANRALPSHP